MTTEDQKSLESYAKYKKKLENDILYHKSAAPFMQRNY